MIRTIKSISPVVATVLLIVISVMSVVGFQTWFTYFESSTLANVESQSGSSFISIEAVLNDILYFKSDLENENLRFLKIEDSNGVEICSYDFILNDNNLVEYWNFEKGNSSHIFSNVNNISSQKINEADNDGKIFSKALKLDGIGDEISIQDSNNLDFTNAFTISAFVRPSVLDMSASGDAYIIAKDDHLASRSYFLRWQTGASIRPRCMVTTSEGTFTAEATADINNFDKIYFFACVYNQSNIKLYIDGVLNSTSGVDGAFAINTNQRLSIGASSNNNEFFNGSIDEVRLYNISLNDQDIESLYYFNTIYYTMNKGINTMYIKGCNLQKGKTYNIVAFTNANKVEEKVVVR